MINRGALFPAEIRAFVDTAAPGASVKFAWGDRFPRSHPGVTAIRKLKEQGLIDFHPQRRGAGGGFEYFIFRTGKARSDGNTAIRAMLPETPEGIIMAELRYAAAYSRPCPTNAELARKAGLPDAAAASYIVGKLRSAGKIHVQLMGPGKRRVVTIAASGARTRMEALQ